MEGIQIAFTFFQALSCASALFLLLLSSRLGQSPLIRLNAVVAALSNAIVLAGIAYTRFDFSAGNLGISRMFCWSQGLALQFLFLTQHISMSLLCLNIFMRIVYGKSKQWEQRATRYMVGLALGLPLLIVAVTGALADPQRGIEPRACWCFVAHPTQLRIYGYTFWYMAFAVPGTVLIAGVIYTLIARTRNARAAQLEEQARSSGTATKAELLGGSANSSSNAVPSIPHETIYRMVLFVAIYMILAGMSYIQSLVWALQTIRSTRVEPSGGSAAVDTERDNIGFAKFSSALVGFGMALIFATGAQARAVYVPFIKHRILRISE